MDIILKYFPDLSDHQKNQFEQLKSLYNDWNSKINVISRKDFEHFYERHVLHSLSIAKIISFKKNTSVLDVGTGGGFPGVPLAILFPETKFTLIDSIGKKIKVVSEVSTAINLKNVNVQHVRVEDLYQTFDFIISRAVTAFPRFVEMLGSKITAKGNNSLANGIIYLKGGDFDEEIKTFGKKLTIYPISIHFTEEFFETKKIIHLPIKNK